MSDNNTALQPQSSSESGKSWVPTLSGFLSGAIHFGVLYLGTVLTIKSADMVSKTVKDFADKK